MNPKSVLMRFFFGQRQAFAEQCILCVCVCVCDSFMVSLGENVHGCCFYAFPSAVEPQMTLLWRQ